MELIVLGLLIVVVVLVVKVQSLTSRVETLEQHTQVGITSSSKPRTETSQYADAHVAAAEMVNPDLLRYIKDQYAHGVVREEILAKLRAHGWQESAVQAAFGSLRSSVNEQPMVPALAPQPNRLWEWLREDWLLKIGALLLLIALGWFTTYAFMNNWIGEAGRITLGLMVGALFLVLGSWRIRRVAAQGGVFLVVGSTTILLTTYAARFAYDMFSPASALAVMFLSVLVVAVMGVRYERPALSRAALVMAAVAPLLTDSPQPSWIGLFSYLTVVILGAALVAAYSRDRVLIPLSLGVLSLYSVPIWEGDGGAERPVLFIFALAFVAMFFVLHAQAVLRRASSFSGVDVLAALWSGLFLLVWVVSVAPEVWQSLLLATWAVVYAVGSFVLFRALRDIRIFGTYAGVGAVLLAAATAAELSGPALVIAYTVQAGVAVLLVELVTRSARAVQVVSWLLMVPAVMTIPYLEPWQWQPEQIAETLSVTLTTTAVFGLLSGWLWYVRGVDPGIRRVGIVLGVFCTLFIYILWWRICMVLLPETLAVLVALSTYTIIGIGTYVTGQRQAIRALQWYGGLLIGFVVARLLFVDVWQLSMVGRIVTFALIGLLLMATAFISQRRTS
jgi:hypothetical protein